MGTLESDSAVQTAYMVQKLVLLVIRNGVVQKMLLVVIMLQGCHKH